MSETTQRTTTTEWRKRREEALDRDNYTCQECSEPVGESANPHVKDAHVHHEEAKADGGSDALDNLTTLCSECHREIHGERRSGKSGEVVDVNRNGKPIDEKGRFTSEFTDDEFITALQDNGGATTSEVADAVGCKYRTAYKRLKDLEDEGRVTSRSVGNSLLWTASEED
jgi:hypothetical protein